MQGNIFHEKCVNHPATENLGPGAVLLRGLAEGQQERLIAGVREIAAIAPFRHMVTPGGFRMSVAMTNCGPLGWITDRKGYRYSPVDPERNLPWPAIPDTFMRLAQHAASFAGYRAFEPDACLINRYEVGARMTLHQDKDEKDFSAPIVSVSLGLSATFQFGGLTRKERPTRYSLASGDVVVWGGESRLYFHGVTALKAGEHPLTGPIRYNLTFRKTS